MVLVEFTSRGSDRVTYIHNLVGAICTVHSTVSLGVSSQGSGGDISHGKVDDISHD
jgi:hypothetical protein